MSHEDVGNHNNLGRIDLPGHIIIQGQGNARLCLRAHQNNEAVVHQGGQERVSGIDAGNGACVPEVDAAFGVGREEEGDNNGSTSGGQVGNAGGSLSPVESAAWA